MKPIVSIIMPAYNADKYIEESIRSVLDQKFEKWELIITNDGSTDKTFDIIRSISDERIKVLNQDNRGVSVARNNAIAVSRGEWLAFLDADDIWFRDKLSEQSKYFSNHDIIFSPALFLGGLNSGRSTAYFKPNVPVKSRELLKLLIKQNIIDINSVCFRKKIVSKFFDERLSFGEDYELWLRIFSKSPRFKYLHKTLSKYRIHDKSTVMNTNDQALKLSNILFEFSNKTQGDISKEAYISASNYYCTYINQYINEAMQTHEYKKISTNNNYKIPSKLRLKVFLYNYLPHILNKKISHGKKQ